MKQPGIRGDILAAAEQLITVSGIQAATTRAIAKAAGCSEGSIYRHFRGKNALVLEVVNSCFPEFVEALVELGGRAGKGSVEHNLRKVAGKALNFYRAMLPITSGVLSDQNLLEEHRLRFKPNDPGPLRALAGVASYLEQERALGRISSDVSADDGARMLLGTLLAQAFLEALAGNGRGGKAADEDLVDGIVVTLWRALRPVDDMASTSA